MPLKLETYIRRTLVGYCQTKEEKRLAKCVHSVLHGYVNEFGAHNSSTDATVLLFIRFWNTINREKKYFINDEVSYTSGATCNRWLQFVWSGNSILQCRKCILKNCMVKLYGRNCSKGITAAESYLFIRYEIHSNVFANGKKRYIKENIHCQRSYRSRYWISYLLIVWIFFISSSTCPMQPRWQVDCHHREVVLRAASRTSRPSLVLTWGHCCRQRGCRTRRRWRSWCECPQ